MAFYISPPGGNISLKKLTQYAVTRFNFLCKVYATGGNRIQIFDILNDANIVKDAECLIEGTVKDKVSHFILRLACCCNGDMASFLLKAETLLFDYRFTCMTEEELCRLFKSVESLRKASCSKSKFSSDKSEYVTHFLKIMSQIKGENSKWRTVVRRYLNGEESFFMVPFWTVLPLVAARQVSLNQGTAFVPVGKLRDTVTSLFEELLYYGIKKACEVFHTDDKRIVILLRSIKGMFRDHFRNQNPVCNLQFDLCHTEVDDMVHRFPPCMSHLHRTLGQNHRLKHHSRIQYTLFLKEAGMSVHEALMFWRKEYNKFPSNSDGCTHMWSKDEGRYTYNIRHLYGLEGSRINYRGHSCALLQQSNHGPQDSGGCPFSHFDDAHLLQLLHAEGISCSGDSEKILHWAKEKEFSQACVHYFHVKMKLIKDEKVLGLDEGERGQKHGPLENLSRNGACKNTQINTEHSHVEQNIPLCKKCEDTVSCCCYSDSACYCENCHANSESHCHSNTTCCQHLNDSNLTPSADMTEFNQKPEMVSHSSTKSNFEKEHHSCTSSSEQLLAANNISSNKDKVCDCTVKVPTLGGREDVCETKSKAHSKHLHTSSVDCEVVSEKYVLFQKPVEYLESSRLYLNEVS